MLGQEMIFAVDSREQRPYPLEGAEVVTLPAGDYSIVGLEDRVTVERKSRSDAYRSLGYGRARFEREMRRLVEYDFAAIVVESTLPDFLLRPRFSRMNPRSAVSTLLAWSVKFRVPVYFAGDRRHGMAVTRKLLEYYWRYHREVTRV